MSDPRHDDGRDPRAAHLRGHLEPPLSDGMLQREWGDIAERLDRGPRLAFPRFAAVAGAGLAAIAAVWYAGPLTPPGPAAPVAVVGDAVDPVPGAPAEDVRLEDGSFVSVDGGGTLRVVTARADRVRVALDRGRARFDVAKNPDRAFVVSAGSVTVTVIGTRFSVDRRRAGTAAEAVEVVVDEGRVRVDGPGGVHRVLGADDRWAVPLPAVPTPAARERDPAATVSPGDEPSAAAEDADRPRRAGRRGAEALFESAGALRRAGEIRPAIRRYEELVRRHPRDPRAALAAFEIGRLRMDRLGDPRGAARAFGRALAASPPAGVREDAMARVAEAWDQAGDARRCRRAQQAYLGRYPAGVHAGAVRRLACD